MKYKRRTNLDMQTSDEIRKENTSIKRTITQIDSIINKNSDTLTIKDADALITSKETLLMLIKQRETFAKKKATHSKKIEKMKKDLKKEMDKLDRKKILSYILAKDLRAFELFSPTFQEAYSDFLDINAKVIIEQGITAIEFLEKLEYSIENISPKHYITFISEYNRRAKELKLID